MSSQHLILFIVLLSGTIASILTKKLTVSGAVLGGVFGVLLFMAAGWMGLLLMAIFFILGTVATSWGRNKKEFLGIAEHDKGRRKGGQVAANGGAGALLSILILIFPDHISLLRLMIAAAFSSAAADTVSSELGSVYGKKFYNILSLKKDIRGRDGAISVEGTVFGIAASAVIAAVYGAGFGWQNFLPVIAAGTIGNLADSLLGATLERKKVLSNDAVNFLNTGLAALSCFLFV